MKMRLTITIALLVLVMLFTLQNIEVVTITFLFWQFSLPRALLFFLVLITGIISGWILHSIARRAKH